MTVAGWQQIALFTAIIGLLTRPLGGYLVRVYAGERTLLQPLIEPIEAALYRLAGINRETEQSWYQYAVSLLVFHEAGIIVLYALLRLQPAWPFNPQGLPEVSPVLALNTAVSFVTNTSWQSYSGETTLSYASQMAGIAVQSFLSAASGMAVAIALIRGFARRRSATIGCFWIDLTRGTLYVLLPICVIAASFLAAAGVPQTLAPSAEATTLEGARQVIARGPVATQEAIKLLSGDGGGFFNANSAHRGVHRCAADCAYPATVLYVGTRPKAPDLGVAASRRLSGVHESCCQHRCRGSRVTLSAHREDR